MRGTRPLVREGVQEGCSPTAIAPKGGCETHAASTDLVPFPHPAPGSHPAHGQRERSSMSVVCAPGLESPSSKLCPERGASPSTVLAPTIKRCKLADCSVDGILDDRCDQALKAGPANPCFATPEKHQQKTTSDEGASCSRPAQDPRALELRVEDAVAAEMDHCDPHRTLDGSDYFNVLTDVSETVTRVMREQGRPELGEHDHGYIHWRGHELMRPGPGASEAIVVPQMQSTRGSQEAPPVRFEQLDRVVCRVDGRREWASGVVHLHPVNDGSTESQGQPTMPCVHVMVDGGRLIAVHENDCHLQRAANCSGCI